jgi:hypothetical protein
VAFSFQQAKSRRVAAVAAISSSFVGRSDRVELLGRPVTHGIGVSFMDIDCIIGDISTQPRIRGARESLLIGVLAGTPSPPPAP